VIRHRIRCGPQTASATRVTSAIGLILVSHPQDSHGRAGGESGESPTRESGCRPICGIRPYPKEAIRRGLIGNITRENAPGLARHSRRSRGRTAQTRRQPSYASRTSSQRTTPRTGAATAERGSRYVRPPVTISGRSAGNEFSQAEPLPTILESPALTAAESMGLR